jgi:hypothetical protein
MKRQEHVNSTYNVVESDCTLMACDLLTTWCITEMGALAWADISSEYAPGYVFSFSKNVELHSYPIQHY